MLIFKEDFFNQLIFINFTSFLEDKEKLFKYVFFYQLKSSLNLINLINLVNFL